jgi:hypothetical protein
MVAHFAYLLFPIEIYQVDGELHEEAVYRFAGHYPKPAARLQVIVLEQPRTPLGAGIGNFGRIRQHGIASLVADQDFQAPLIIRNAAIT